MVFLTVSAGETMVKFYGVFYHHITGETMVYFNGIIPWFIRLSAGEKMVEIQVWSRDSHLVAAATTTTNTLSSY